MDECGPCLVNYNSAASLSARSIASIPEAPSVNEDDFRFLGSNFDIPQIDSQARQLFPPPTRHRRSRRNSRRNSISSCASFGSSKSLNSDVIALSNQAPLRSVYVTSKQSVRGSERHQADEPHDLPTSKLIGPYSGPWNVPLTSNHDEGDREQSDNEISLATRSSQPEQQKWHPDLEGARSVAIQAIVQAFFISTRPAAGDVGDTGTPRTHDPLSPKDSGGEVRPSAGKEKHRGKKRRGNDSDDDVDREDNDIGKAENVFVTKQAMLACPFFKKDCSRHHCCRRFGFKEIHRVK
jgi:hypothetical protein